jgi:hypothetical protein
VFNALSWYNTTTFIKKNRWIRKYRGISFFNDPFIRVKINNLRLKLENNYLLQQLTSPQIGYEYPKSFIHYYLKSNNRFLFFGSSTNKRVYFPKKYIPLKYKNCFSSEYNTIEFSIRAKGKIVNIIPNEHFLKWFSWKNSNIYENFIPENNHYDVDLELMPYLQGYHNNLAYKKLLYLSKFEFQNLYFGQKIIFNFKSKKNKNNFINYNKNIWTEYQHSPLQVTSLDYYTLVQLNKKKINETTFNFKSIWKKVFSNDNTDFADKFFHEIYPYIKDITKPKPLDVEKSYDAFFYKRASQSFFNPDFYQSQKLWIKKIETKPVTFVDNLYVWIKDNILIFWNIPRISLFSDFPTYSRICDYVLDVYDVMNAIFPGFIFVGYFYILWWFLMRHSTSFYILQWWFEDKLEKYLGIADENIVYLLTGVYCTLWCNQIIKNSKKTRPYSPGMIINVVGDKKRKLPNLENTWTYRKKFIKKYFVENFHPLKDYAKLKIKLNSIKLNELIQKQENVKKLIENLSLDTALTLEEKQFKLEKLQEELIELEAKIKSYTLKENVEGISSSIFKEHTGNDLKIMWKYFFEKYSIDIIKLYKALRKENTKIKFTAKRLSTNESLILQSFKKYDNNNYIVTYPFHFRFNFRKLKKTYKSLIINPVSRQLYSNLYKDLYGLSFFSNYINHPDRLISSWFDRYANEIIRENDYFDLNPYNFWIDINQELTKEIKVYFRGQRYEGIPIGRYTNGFEAFSLLSGLTKKQRKEKIIENKKRFNFNTDFEDASLSYFLNKEFFYTYNPYMLVVNPVERKLYTDFKKFIVSSSVGTTTIKREVRDENIDKEVELLKEQQSSIETGHAINKVTIELLLEKKRKKVKARNRFKKAEYREFLEKTLQEIQDWRKQTNSNNPIIDILDVYVNSRLIYFDWSHTRRTRRILAKKLKKKKNHDTAQIMLIKQLREDESVLKKEYLKLKKILNTVLIDRERDDFYGIPGNIPKILGIKDEEEDNISINTIDDLASIIDTKLKENIEDSSNNMYNNSENVNALAKNKEHINNQTYDDIVKGLSAILFKDLSIDVNIDRNLFKSISDKIHLNIYKDSYKNIIKDPTLLRIKELQIEDSINNSVSEEKKKVNFIDIVNMIMLGQKKIDITSLFAPKVEDSILSSSNNDEEPAPEVLNEDLVDDDNANSKSETEEGPSLSRANEEEDSLKLKKRRKLLHYLPKQIDNAVATRKKWITSKYAKEFYEYEETFDILSLGAIYYKNKEKYLSSSFFDKVKIRFWWYLYAKKSFNWFPERIYPQKYIKDKPFVQNEFLKRYWYNWIFKLRKKNKSKISLTLEKASPRKIDHITFFTFENTSQNHVIKNFNVDSHLSKSFGSHQFVKKNYSWPWSFLDNVKQKKIQIILDKFLYKKFNVSPLDNYLLPNNHYKTVKQYKIVQYWLSLSNHLIIKKTWIFSWLKRGIRWIKEQLHINYYPIPSENYRSPYWRFRNLTFLNFNPKKERKYEKRYMRKLMKRYPDNFYRIEIARLPLIKKQPPIYYNPTKSTVLIVQYLDEQFVIDNIVRKEAIKRKQIRELLLKKKLLKQEQEWKLFNNREQVLKEMKKLYYEAKTPKERKERRRLIKRVKQLLKRQEKLWLREPTTWEKLWVDEETLLSLGDKITSRSLGNDPDDFLDFIDKWYDVNHIITTQYVSKKYKYNAMIFKYLDKIDSGVFLKSWSNLTYPNRASLHEILHTQYDSTTRDRTLWSNYWLARLKNVAHHHFYKGVDQDWLYKSNYAPKRRYQKKKNEYNSFAYDYQQSLKLRRKLYPRRLKTKFLLDDLFWKHRNRTKAVSFFGGVKIDKKMHLSLRKIFKNSEILNENFAFSKDMSFDSYVKFLYSRYSVSGKTMDLKRNFRRKFISKKKKITRSYINLDEPTENIFADLQKPIVRRRGNVIKDPYPYYFFYEGSKESVMECFLTNTQKAFINSFLTPELEYFNFLNLKNIGFLKNLNFILNMFLKDYYFDNKLYEHNHVVLFQKRRKLKLNKWHPYTAHRIWKNLEIYDWIWLFWK